MVRGCGFLVVCCQASRLNFDQVLDSARGGAAESTFTGVSSEIVDFESCCVVSRQKRLLPTRANLVSGSRFRQ